MLKNKVSVIIPAYNVRNYLANCLESVVSQTYGLENLEIIVVDDKSPDLSYEICEAYEDLPQINIKLMKHTKNMGAGGARNTGLSYSTGDYIMFLDGDDFLDHHAIEVLVDDIEAHHVDMVFFDYQPFSSDGRFFAKNPSSKLFDKERCLSRYEYAQFTALSHAISPCCKLYKRELLRDKELFSINLCYEDVLPHVRLLSKSQSIYLSKKTIYHYRQRALGDAPSLMSSAMSPEKIYGQLSISENLKTLAEDHKDLSYMINWLNMRLSAAHIKAAFEKDTILKSEEQKGVYERFRVSLGNCDPLQTYHKEFSLAARRIIQALQTSQSLVECIKHFEPSRLNMITQKISVVREVINSFKRFKPVRVIRKRYRLLVKKSNTGDKDEKKSIKSTINKFKLDVKKIGRLQTRSGKELWLIGERDGQARDGGFFLFKYLRENHPEINAFYLIDEAQRDFHKVEGLGNWIQIHSEEHMRCFVESTHLICTHSRGTLAPWGSATKNVIAKYYPEYLEKKYIMIQHGINVGNFTTHFHKNNIVNAGFSLLISGAKREFDFMREHFGYENGEVVYTGLARFDNLYSKIYPITKIKKILVMPTWRSGIVSPTWKNVKNRNDSIFLESNYYKSWQDFLNNKLLNWYLDRNGIELYFYPHPEVQSYSKYFYSGSERVIIAEDSNYDLQELIETCDMVITDYSSIFFDFAYMKKPVLYYQFDYKEFFSNHYKKGYFNFNDDAFGPISYDLRGILKELFKVIYSGGIIEDIYLQRRKKFFELHDGNNCSRIVNSIKNV